MLHYKNIHGNNRRNKCYFLIACWSESLAQTVLIQGWPTFLGFHYVGSNSLVPTAFRREFESVHIWVCWLILVECPFHIYTWKKLNFKSDDSESVTLGTSYRALSLLQLVIDWTTILPFYSIIININY